MKQVNKKNYAILIVLLVGTIFLTLMLSNIYLAKNKLVSNFYEYSNKIDTKEFEAYMVENSDFIIYISDKFDLSHESFENEFKLKLEKLNLKEKLVFIDKNDISSDFLSALKNNYNINIDITRTPMLIVIIDNKAIKNVYIDEYSNVDTIIDYEAFEW